MKGRLIKDIAYGMRGEIITTAKSMQMNVLMNDVEGLTILGLGASTNSAPFIPALREAAPKAKIRKVDSINNVKASCSDGWATRIPIAPQISITTNERMHMKVYLHLTKLRPVVG